MKTLIPCFCLAGFLLFAQSDLVINTETRIVPIEVIVKDSKGQPVEDLTKENFTIFDNGQARSFQTFSHERADAVTSSGAAEVRPANVFTNRVLPAGSDHHVTVVFLDGASSGWANYVRNLPSVVGLVRGLKPGEPVAIYSATPRLHVVQDFTTDRELLERRLRGLRPPPDFKPPPGEIPAWAAAVMSASPGERSMASVGNQRDLQTAMRQLTAHLATLPGRKSLVWLAGGFPPRMLSEWRGPWDDILEGLNAANIALNPVNANPWNTLAARPSGNDVLSDFAKRTGGEMSYQGNDIATALAHAVGERNSTYTLGFYLRGDERDNGLHSLTVKVNRAGIDLHYRQGYIPNSDRRLAALDQTATKTGDLLHNPLDAGEIPFSVTVDPVSHGRQVFHIKVEPQAVRLAAHGSGWSVKIEQQFFQMDDDGDVYAKISNTKIVEAEAASRGLLNARGPAWSEEMPVVSKATLLRIILRDPETKRTGSLTIPLK